MSCGYQRYVQPWIGAWIGDDSNNQKSLIEEFPLRKCHFDSYEEHNDATCYYIGEKPLSYTDMLRVSCEKGISVINEKDQSKIMIPFNKTVLFLRFEAGWGKGVDMVLAYSGKNWLFKITKPYSSIRNWNEIKKLKILYIDTSAHRRML